jgi:MSHA biogenesis protein MshL
MKIASMTKSAVFFTVATLALLAGCAAPAYRYDSYDLIAAQMKAEAGKPAQQDAVAAALLPPLKIDLPKARELLEERFNVNFNEVPARQFFSAIAEGTRFSVLLDPKVDGFISANLKDVTLFEALDAVRELYGYDYRVDGTRIYIRPLTMQTRMFHVNYLTGSRKGNSNLRVSSTSISNSGGGGGNSNSNSNNNSNQSGSGSSSQGQDSSGVSTVSSSDFWAELKASLEAIVGGRAGAGTDGSSVVISAQSGVVVIRAMPEELRNVNLYLKAMQISVDRQVILEAKILEVQLNDSFQTGINWAAFGSINGNPISAGFVSPSATLAPLIGGVASSLSSAGAASITATAGSSLGAAAGASGSLFGLAFQTGRFATLISFLESQGTVHVLSSPRIAAMNNQKAVLKIGTDEYYVTGVSTTTSTTGTSSTTSPNVTLQPFFSGVVLDVTPQIDNSGNILLHVHPSVSQVSTVTKGVNLGAAGSLSLPLAASSTSEMDSIVRGQDGQIVAIGGLMRQSTSGDRSQLPLIGDLPGLGALFRNRSQMMRKSELVVLIKPTIVKEDSWTDDIRAAGNRIDGLQPREPTERR